ncbi:hypothetical protein ACP3T3_01235 [Chryseobacterium sp. CBSDS_008]|uniref:hypothetical protein n=1 Tax=Chryseobacterium sp. CBSDS_008 TaxID=3415265 RepID=UPI003CFB6F61
MKSIVIYPDNPKQFSVIEAFLEEMKISFKSQEEIIISEEIKQSVLEGIKDAEEGRLISSEEVRKSSGFMFEIECTEKAERLYLEALEFWINHNK